MTAIYTWLANYFVGKLTDWVEAEIAKLSTKAAQQKTNAQEQSDVQTQLDNAITRQQQIAAAQAALKGL